MDDAKPSEAQGLPLQGPHWHRYPEAEPARDFVPLRLVLQGNGQVVEVTRPDMLLGRHSEMDIRISLPDVSRRHCRLLFSDGRWHVFDLNSLNGVFVNGERVTQAVLHQQDLLRIGGFIFQVEVHSGDSTVQLPPDRHGSAADVLKSISTALPWKPPAQGMTGEKE